MKSELLYVFWLNRIQINFLWLIVLLWFHWGQKTYLKTIVQRQGSLFGFLVFLFHTYARWKGTGEPWPNCTLKWTKFFPLHFWKILCVLISLCSPLSHAMWIFDQHPSVKTLTFLDHCGRVSTLFFKSLNKIINHFLIVLPASSRD